MSENYWNNILCLVPISPDIPKFFGFSDFLTGLAFMVLAWTIADVRYRFRVNTAPLPLPIITFTIMGIIGVLTLMTDLWRASKWLVPKAIPFTQAEWQAFLGGLFLLTFLVWAWFALVRPPKYGRLNAKRYSQALYKIILKGSPEDLSVIADEFTRAVKPIIHYLPTTNSPWYNKSSKKSKEKPPIIAAYAHDILLLIGDKRFCREIVKSSPVTALVVFNELGKSGKYSPTIGIFAKNIVGEALANKDSFIFHESEGYESGLIGHLKPLSQAMFSNYEMVEAIGTLLDTDFEEMAKWDAAQWNAYCRIVLITLTSYAGNNFWSHSFVLYRAISNLDTAMSDLYKINGDTNTNWDNPILARLRVIIGFIKEAIEILEKKSITRHIQLRIRQQHGPGTTFYDHLAKMILEAIFYASKVGHPTRLCWLVQHNLIWCELFNFNRLQGPAAKILKFKVRRLIYEEITEMNQFPNFRAATILGYCLNVMGLKTDYDDKSMRDSKALHLAVLSWTKKNYTWLQSYNSEVAEACLMNGITYDKEHRRLVKTYPAGGLRREAAYEYFDLDPPPLDMRK